MPSGTLPPYLRMPQCVEELDRTGWSTDHPAVIGPKRRPFISLWNATCRIVTDHGMGSGFFVESDFFYVVTCAHVIDRAARITVERPIGSCFLERFRASLVAVDYAHDLAVLELEDVDHQLECPGVANMFAKIPLVKLRLGKSPSPGDSVTICGYPIGVDTPRLARGLVSGYDKTELESVSIYGLALDASLNPGNSGGPICDKDGRVVGVVFARAAILAREEIRGVGRNTARLLTRLNANNGIGYALDPAHVKALLDSLQEWKRRTASREYREYAPTEIELSREAFIQLQVECRDLNLSPIGIFSFAPDCVLYHGWYNDVDRKQLSVRGWDHVLWSISRNGGSFLIRGMEILLYRAKYRGYIVPVVLKLV